MDRIVLAYDASPASRAALDWVAHRYGRTDAEVALVHLSEMFSDGEEGSAPGPEALDRLRAAAPELRIAEPGVRGPGGAGTLTVLGVRRERASGWRPFRVTAQAAGPVCLIPEGWAADGQPVTVGVRCDGKGAGTVRRAADEAAATGVPLRTVHAWLSAPAQQRTEVRPLLSPREVTAMHRGHLERALDAARAAHPTLDVEQVLVHDNATSALSAFSERSSMLVIGNHTRSLVAGWLLGSVALDLIGALPIPVCVVPHGSPTGS